MAEIKYFVPINNEGTPCFVWYFDGKGVSRVGIPDPKNSPKSYIAANSEQDLLAAIATQFEDFFNYGAPHVLKQMKLKPGQYYSRMARPTDIKSSESPGNCPEPKLYEHEIALSKGQLVSLMDRLKQICQTIHPVTETYKSYGHEIRNLLILACTEVEAQWKSILEIHQVSPQNGKYYTTKDYAKLNQAMHLNEYIISLTHYPWLSGFHPFKEWDSDKPTESLDWYDAYNKVKHDREKNFQEAKLIHAINAVCACMIMLLAQFGRQQVTRARQEVAHFFELIEAPKWCASELYTYPYTYDGITSGYTSIKYPF